MVTRTHQRMAALAAVATAAPLTLGLALFGEGPPSGSSGATRSYFVEHATTTRITALLWLVAAMAMVVFAVAVREAIWAIVVDRTRAAMLFVQAAASALSADVAGILWAVDRTLWRFATWASALYGFAAWLVLAGLTFARPRLRRRQEVTTTELVA